MVVIKKKGLGRGLEALLGDKVQKESATDIHCLPLTALQAGKYQPRQKMEAGALQELAESIREQGVMQPLLVRLVAPGKYEIIAGERRFRAATLAGLKEVPVLVTVTLNVLLGIFLSLVTVIGNTIFVVLNSGTVIS
jgi:ParB family chromosome partitioning protein